ncbi:MAG: homoserine O-acetyltransferase family protein [Burkholderiales bacterium]
MSAVAVQLDPVETKFFTAKNFRLRGGATLPNLTIAYEHYGRLAPNRRNAVLVTHGFTNHHHAAGRRADGSVGWWDGLIGPGKAIDTDRFFVVSSNMLGSSFGSTNPASIDPKIGKPYGPDFPEITLPDILAAQKALLDSMHIEHLVAVAGRSYGGFQAFAWGVTYPEFMDGLVIANSAPKRTGGDKAVHDLITRFERDPNWNGGRYYDNGGIVSTLAALRLETLKRYGFDTVLAERYLDPTVRAALLERQAQAWAEKFDANGMIALLRAAVRFDAEKDFHKIRAKILYTLTTTDVLYPPAIARDVMAKLEASGVDATYFLLESPYGHDATTPDAAKFAPVLRSFMERISTS